MKQAWRRLRKRYKCADVSDQPDGTFREINEQAAAVSDGMYKNSGKGGGRSHLTMKPAGMMGIFCPERICMMVISFL